MSIINEMNGEDARLSGSPIFEDIPEGKRAEIARVIQERLCRPIP
jgi:hypothetical protein